MGKGVEAAVLMSQLRTALRAYALDGHGPAQVAERLNRLLEPGRPGRMTTLAYLVLDPERERVTMVSAGHLPPLVVGPDGRASYLPAEGDPPLGVSRVTRFTERGFDVPAGSRVVLFTDGAVEVRTESIDEGLGRLRELAMSEPDPRRFCDIVAEGAVIQRAPADDLAVMAISVGEIPDRLEGTWPARTRSLPPLRHLIRRWLIARGADVDETYDITVAVQEACANAVEHAYGPAAADFRLEAECVDGTVVVSVHDRGHWREPRGLNRGRGLPLMRALMDSVDVAAGSDGTTVVLRRRLGAGDGS
jgi:anti-sigma regulatory factor (Ser/Thr protein kinase)